MVGDIAVIGAGSSGLAVLRALRKHGITVDSCSAGAPRTRVRKP
jgi:cation diffusion facilitator CzcD-associated flavoprotein CzcO